MENYVIIDARNFDVRCVLIGHEESSIVILENRQYLPPCEQKIWEKKFPEIIEKIERDYTGKEKIFLFPESVCLNLTIEISENNSFTVEQKIAHVLYKNFHLYPSKMGYKFLNLDKNRYVIILIEQKFLKYIKRALLSEKTREYLFFPPFIGLLNCFKNLDLKETSIAVFFEKKLRRFFVKNQTEINFIDIYQTSETSHKSFFKDVRTTQRLIFQSLNIEDKNKKLFLFGDIPEAMKEIYEKEYGKNVSIVESFENASGFIENISVIAQCLYFGIDRIVNTKDCPLNVFNFSSLVFHTSVLGGLKKKLEAHKKFISIFLLLWLVIVMLALGYTCYENTIFRKRSVAFTELQNQVDFLKKCSKSWEKQNQVRCFIPKIFLKYYDIFQTIPGKFCIDGIGTVSEKDKCFCCVRGRIYEDDFAEFEKNLSKKLKTESKLDLKTEIWEDNKLHYRVKIPIKIPKQLR